MENNLTKIQLKNIKSNIKNEVLLQQKLKDKLFVIQNVYPVSNILQNNNNNKKSKKEYFLDIKIAGKKNQNEELINYIKKLLYQYPTLIKFLSENFKNQTNPLDISLYFTIDNKPIILVNKRGFHLIDFEALLLHSNRKITPNNFTFTSNSKLF